MWNECSCGVSYYCANENVKRSTLSRCRKKHLEGDKLALRKGHATTASTLFVILSHGGTSSVKDQHTKLHNQLLSLGVKEQNIDVVYGVNSKKFQHKGKLLRPNQVTHYSVRHRWFRRVARLLESMRHIRCVCYLEYNTKLERSLDDVITAVMNVTGPEIRWLGFRKVWPANKWKHKHDKPVIEGSKLICFIRGGLQKAWTATCKSKLYSHWDCALCRFTTTNDIYRPVQSFVGVRAHDSVPGKTKRLATTAAMTRTSKKTQNV